jgi:hypothetical protein
MKFLEKKKAREKTTKTMATGLVFPPYAPSRRVLCRVIAVSAPVCCWCSQSTIEKEEKKKTKTKKKKKKKKKKTKKKKDSNSVVYKLGQDMNHRCCCCRCGL